MAEVERRNIPPINPLAAIGEADRSKVYSILGNHAADILTGSQSYFPDGVQRDERGRLANLNSFISSIDDFRQHVDDPSNLLGEAVDHFKRLAERLGAQIDANEPSDSIELPPDRSPATKDNNIIQIDPDGGPFLPNPRLQRLKDRSASLGFGLDVDSQHGAFRGLVSGNPMLKPFVRLPLFFPLS